MRGDGMLDRQQRNELVVPQDHGPVFGLDHETDVEEAVRKLWMPGLGLGDHVGGPLPRQPAEIVRLRAGNVDRAVPGVLLVIEVEHLVGEALQPALRNADQPHREIHAREPRGSLDHVRDVLEVPLDLLPTPDSSHRLNQANGLVGLDHLKLLSLVALGLLYRYGANQAPSRDVKHAALEKLPLSACTVTTPLGWMNRRPLVALHRSNGTYTLVAGRKPTGSVHGTELVP